MLELTRRELISSAIAAAGLMATSPISSAAASPAGRPPTWDSTATSISNGSWRCAPTW